jgi:phage repressor protein C with HTH and peptisase S24 domain
MRTMYHLCRHEVNTNDRQEATMIPAPSDKPGQRMLSKEEESRRARLRTARVARQYKSARSASATLDLPESTYRSHENGQRPINEASAMLYAERLSVRFDWLWSGAGEMEGDNRKSNNVAHNAETVGRNHVSVPRATPTVNATLPGIAAATSSPMLPIFGRAMGGAGGEIVLDGTVMDSLPGPSGLAGVEGAYGLEVIGESMLNRYRPGEIVWVDPRRAVHKGDYAVFQVRMPSGELHAFIKRFMRFSNGDVIACQHNPEMEIAWPREDVEHIHLIVGTGIR